MSLDMTVMLNDMMLFYVTLIYVVASVTVRIIPLMVPFIVHLLTMMRGSVSAFVMATLMLLRITISTMFTLVFW